MYLSSWKRAELVVDGRNCLDGRDNLCRKGQVAGFARDGGFAEYVLIRVADLNCVPLPDAISDEVAAALGCRFPTGYHAIAHRSGIKAGEWTIPNNTICGSGTVSFYAVDPQEWETLHRRLIEFTRDLPADVEFRICSR